MELKGVTIHIDPTRDELSSPPVTLEHVEQLPSGAQIVFVRVDNRMVGVISEAPVRA